MGQFRSIEERVENFKKYYKKENERPLFGFFYGSEYPIHRYKAAQNLPQGAPLKPEDFNVDAFLDDFDALFEIHEKCGGDFIWSASAFWGIPWIEAMLGCPIYADNITASLSAHKPENINLDFDKNNPWAKLMVEFLQKGTKRSGGRYPFATTRMRGVADLLQAVYGNEEFIFEMIEDPDKIHNLCAKLTDFYIESASLQLENIPDFHGGLGSFYYNAWVPKGTIWHQEDAAALLSPAYYEEFIRPCDEKIVASFGGCFMHEHSTGFVPTKSYIDMGMTALELHIDTGGPTAESLYDWHMTILKEKPLLIWGDIPETDLDWIFNKLPHKGLCVITVVNSVDEAKELWDKYVKE